MALIGSSGESSAGVPGAKKPSLKERWESLAPNKRKNFMLVGVVAFIFVLSALMLAAGGGGKSTTGARNKNDQDGTVQSSLLPDENSREIGMSGLASDVEKTRSDQQKIGEEVRRLKEENDQLRNANSSGAASGRDAQIMQSLAQMREEMNAMKAAGPAAAPAQQVTMEGEEVIEELPAPGYGGIKIIRDNKAGGPSASEGDSASGNDSGDGAEGSASTDSAVNEKAAKVDKPRIGMYLPSGTIITGVLLTGLDAPTGKGAMKDPVPVLVRVKKEAILASRFRADVRECFILASGSGDLPSERAYLRAESVSCITRDKQVVDMKMQAYVVDSDGKAGLRGRLVSKQGSALAKSIIAAFADGVSKAFSGQDRVDFADNVDISYPQAAQSGAVMGASSALDRVAKYYLDLADTLHPILEIDAGRPVTLILIKGQELGVVN